MLGTACDLGVHTQSVNQTIRDNPHLFNVSRWAWGSMVKKLSARRIQLLHINLCKTYQAANHTRLLDQTHFQRQLELLLSDGSQRCIFCRRLDHSVQLPDDLLPRGVAESERPEEKAEDDLCARKREVRISAAEEKEPRSGEATTYSSPAQRM